jgi:hypothetical protein
MNFHSKTDKLKGKEKWLAQLQPLWPAIKGSLALVKKPCIRPQCGACAQGKKHPAWILSVVTGGRRTTLYVPQALVGPIKTALNNGPKIEALLHRGALQMVKDYRRQNPTPGKLPLKT